MRFWPFGKRQRAGSSDAPAATAAPAQVPATRERPPTGAWRQLPALRPTSASLALTAPVQRLADSITSLQRPQVVSAELGHARSPLGPTGSVAGLVRPHRTVQRLDGAVPLAFAHAPEPVEAADAVPVRNWGGVQRLSASASLGDASASTVVGAAGASPSIAVPVLAPATSERSASAIPTLPARSMPARAMPTAPAAPPPPTAAPAVQRLVGAPAAPTLSPSGPAPSPAASTTERSVASAPTPTRPDAPTLGSTRIVRRIGAPMHSRPASMVDAVSAVGQVAEGAQRLPVAAPAAPQTGSTPSSQSAAPIAPPAAGALPTRHARTMAAATGPRLAAAAAAVPARRAPTGADAPITGAAASIQRLSHDAPALTLPKMSSPDGAGGSGGAQVVPARRGVQRAPESVPPTVRSELEPVLGESLADVKVHRGPETGAAARSIQAKAFTTGGAVYMPDEIGSTASGEGRKVLAHELTHVVQQRALGASLPGEDSAEGARLESEARVVGGQDPVPTRPVQPTARPAAAGPAQRLVGSPMPNIGRPMAAAAAGIPAQTGSAMPLSAQQSIVATVQAAASRAGVPAAPASASVSSNVASPGVGVPTVQRLDEVTNSTTATAPTGGTASSPVTSSANAPAEAQPPSEADLETLARQLYPRFRSRLKSDLLSDRERSGRLFDR